MCEFCLEVHRSYCSDLLTRHKILHGNDSFTSPSEEIMLQIFITFKTHLSSARFEPANLGFNGKHDNHQTTDGNFRQSKKTLLKAMINVLWWIAIHPLIISALYSHILYVLPW
jgi:hypothetical protein